MIRVICGVASEELVDLETLFGLEIGAFRFVVSSLAKKKKKKIGDSSFLRINAILRLAIFGSSDVHCTTISSKNNRYHVKNAE